MGVALLRVSLLLILLGSMIEIFVLELSNEWVLVTGEGVILLFLLLLLVLIDVVKVTPEPVGLVLLVLVLAVIVEVGLMEIFLVGELS